jgi:hypothetical protein
MDNSAGDNAAAAGRPSRRAPTVQANEPAALVGARGTAGQG